MKTFIVTIPIAGHLVFEVEAESPEEAREIAQGLPADDGELGYDTLEEFHQGNTCFCPSPWKLTVEEQ